MKMKNVIRSMIVALACWAMAAQSQVFYNMTVISNQLSAPVLLNFAPQTNFANQLMIPHSCLITNVSTNQPMWLGYGAQMAGQSGTNIVTAAYLYTNYTAGWAYKNFGDNTNGFSVVITLPQQALVAPTIPWATFSNAPLTGPFWTNGVVFQ